MKAIVWTCADGHVRITSPRRPLNHADMLERDEDTWINNIAVRARSTDAPTNPRRSLRDAEPHIVPGEGVPALLSLPRTFWLRGATLWEEGGRPEENYVMARDCWRWNGQAVVVDLPLLRTEYLRVLRGECGWRDGRARDRHVDAFLAGAAQAVTRWAAYRQALRDLPARVQADIAALTTPEELEQYQPPWPEV